MKKVTILGLFFLLFLNNLIAATRTVTSNADSGSGTLREALSTAAASDIINFNLPKGSTIKLESHLPIIDKSLTINGSNAARKVTINGQSKYPGFFVKEGVVKISDLNIENCKSQGGRGGNGLGGGGGGGMGAGGGVYIESKNSTVTLTNLSFSNCSSDGGNGGNGVFKLERNGGGGGGLGGNGADEGYSFPDFFAGAGGGLYANASGCNAKCGGGNGSTSDGANSLPSSYGGGGGGGRSVVSSKGENGGFAGGGGAPGGKGGGTESFGGGGAGGFAAFLVDIPPGDGGTGAGRGGKGKDECGGGGGGGAAFGGAIFLAKQPGPQANTLILDLDIDSSGQNKEGTGGFGLFENGYNGRAEGDGIYASENNILSLNTSVVRTIAAQISGPGAVTKDGDGTYILTKTSNNYTGTTTINSGTLIVNGSISQSTTTINSGTLIVNGSISQSTTIESSGTLRGGGKVGPLTVKGTIKPGNSIGTIIVNGPYTQDPGSTHQTEINAVGRASLLDITGLATINNPSTIEVTAQAGDYDIDNTYTVLHSDSEIIGEYATFIITNPNEIDNGTLNIAYTGNSVTASNATVNNVDLIFLTNPDNIIIHARSLGFAAHSLLNQVNHSQSDFGFEQSILRFYQSLCPCHKKGIRPYFSASYLHGNYKDSTYTLAGPFSFAGPVLGFDYWNQNDIIIGGFLNYLRGWNKTSNNTVRSSSNNYTASFYVQKIWKKYFLESAISSTFIDMRKARLSNNTKINEAKPIGYAFAVHTRGVKIFEYKKFIFLPNIALRYFYNHMNAYTEKIQRASRFHISSLKHNILEGLISTNCSYRYPINSSEFIPQFEVTYIRDLLEEKVSYKSTRLSVSETRDHKIQTNPKNCVKLKGALDYRYQNCSILNLSYIASFATNQRITNEVHFGFRIEL